jgi:predicted dehydrogenase
MKTKNTDIKKSRKPAPDVPESEKGGDGQRAGDHRLNVGMVGLGGISRRHRQGYALVGINVCAGCDPSPAARTAVGEENPAITLYDGIDALLADPRVDVVDLVTPHHRLARVPLVRKIAAAGKPLLIQKPIAMDYHDALEMAEICEDAGIPAMVNMNFNFSAPGLHLPRLIHDEGVIGKPAYMHVELRRHADYPADRWFGKDARWNAVSHAVHQLGLLHLLFGPPARVSAQIGNVPSMRGVRVEGFSNYFLEYPDGANAVLLSNGCYYGAKRIPYKQESIFVQGSTGLIDWDGRRYRLCRPEQPQDGDWVEQDGYWFPNAFGLVMEHFRQALAAGSAPLCSLTDQLYVQAVMEAGYRSAASGRHVHLEEIMEGRFDPGYGPGYRHGFAGWVRPELPEGEP